VLQIDTQHLRNAEVMLRETARVGRTGIVAFPTSRTGPTACPVLRGRMPVTRRLPYQWYDTPNIRVGTYKDFEVLAQKNRLRILDAFGLQEGEAVRFLPNARGNRGVPFRALCIKSPHDLPRHAARRGHAEQLHAVRGPGPRTHAVSRMQGDPHKIYDFCAAIVDATADLVCAFKPQIAYFAAHGAEDQLERLMRTCAPTRRACP
jgi:hypothetical protein